MGKGLKVLLAIIMSMSLLFLVACSSNTSSSKDGEIGTVSFYSPETPEMTNDIKTSFEKSVGGKVNIQYAGTNVLVNRMIAEMDNPQADLWYGGGGILPFEAAIEKGFIESYIPESVKDWDVYQNGIKVRHEDWKWVGTEIFVLGLVYNTDLVNEADLPKTWDDLLDPKWKGLLQMPNPAASGTATLLVLSQMMERGEEAAWEYFDKLVKQMSAIPDSGGAPTRAVATGEALIGVGFDFMAYEKKASGETVDFIVPEKTPILVNPVSLVKGGPNPDGGKALIDFMLTEEGQQIKANWYMIPIMPGVESKTPLTLESLSGHAQELDIDWVVKNYDRIRSEWKERYQ